MRMMREHGESNSPLDMIGHGSEPKTRAAPHVAARPDRNSKTARITRNQTRTVGKCMPRMHFGDAGRCRRSFATWHDSQPHQSKTSQFERVLELDIDQNTRATGNRTHTVDKYTPLANWGSAGHGRHKTRVHTTCTPLQICR